MSTNEPLTMRWLYTSTAIITPARRLAISDAKLRFELAFLEFHMHFGNMQYRDQLAILREEMLKDLCYNGKSYPPKVFTWLLSMYTGKEPFQDGKNTEKEGDIQYCEGISMEDWHRWMVGPGRCNLVPFIAKMKQPPLNHSYLSGPLFCWEHLERVFFTNTGRLKSIYLSPMERFQDLSTLDKLSAPVDIQTCFHRFNPMHWLNDEIINAYAQLCEDQDAAWIGSTRVYSSAASHFKGKYDILVVLDCFYPGRFPGSRESKMAVKTKMLTKLLASKQSLIFPIHWDNNHWFTVRGNKARLSWEVYDSIPNPNATKTVIQTLQKFFSMTDLGINCQHWQIVQVDVSHQKNSYDCGIYTCQWIKHLAFGRGIPDWSGKDCEDLRKMMCLEIVEGKLRWTSTWGFN